MKPVVIAVAITGLVSRKTDNPALPATPAEQVERTRAAFEAGANLVRIHVRDPDESASSDPALFGQVQEGVRIDRDRLAVSNTELVQLAASPIARHDSRPATLAKARPALGLAA